MASAPDEPVALEDLSAELGLPLDRWDLDSFQLAAAMQRVRRRKDATDRDGVTRSALLFALCRRSTAVAAAMSDAGMDLDDYARLIDVSATEEVVEEPGAAVVLEPELAGALREHLERGAPVTGERLAGALLRSATSGGGLFGMRLRRLRVDLARAIRNLDARTPHESAPPDRFIDREFSESVIAARKELGPAAQVTASAIVQVLQREHSAYGSRSFGSVALDAEAGSRRATDEWLVAARRLYDLTAVAATRHKVVDGTLVILALADLDGSLAEQLNRTPFLYYLQSEAEVQPERDVSDRTEWSSDSPATTDLLGRAGLAAALVERISRIANTGPFPRESFLVHVDGPWGAGKSSLFNFLEQRLRPAGFLVVPVNAWREQRVGVQWWTLLSALQRAVARDARGLRRAKVWAQGLADRIRARWVTFGVAMLVLVGIVAGVLAGLNLTEGAEAADAALKIISLVSAVSAALVAAVRYLIPGSKKTAEQLIENSENPTRQVGQLFARTLSRSPRPVVFLIDDLDRCDAEYVVDFLEVVQTLVRTAPTFLDRRRPSRRRKPIVGPFGFIAADGRWIRASYEKRFAGFETTTAPGRPLGYLFLEKIFQLHVLLPVVTPAARDAYFGSLLTPGAPVGRTEADDALIRQAQDAVKGARNERELLSAGRMAQQIGSAPDRIRLLGETAARFSEPAIEHAATHLLTRFADLIDPNPRSMRLFVNTYGVLRSLRAIEEVLVPSEPLALWTVVEVRWPQLADFLREHPDTVDAWAAGEPIPDGPGRLLEDPAVREVFRDQGWGRLDAERIRACAGSERVSVGARERSELE